MSVLEFTGVTYADLPVEKVIKSASEAGLDGMICVGYDENGDLFLATSMGDLDRINWLLDCAKKKLLENV